MKVFYTLLAVFFAIISSDAQQVVTLQECLEIGLQNNLDFQLRQLDVLTAETTYRHPIMEYLPAASVSGSHNYNIGSVIDPSTNTRVSSNILTDNLSLNATINLLDFNVFTKARRDKIAILKAKADKEATAAEYAISVLDLYITAYYSQELLKIQIEQFENAKFNLNRITSEVEIGSRPKSDLYDMQMSYSLEENNLLQTKQLLYNQKLALLQFLNAKNMQPDAVILSGFEANATTENASVKEVVANFPAVKAATLGVKVAEKNIAMQRNLYLPVVSGFYSYSSFYYLPLNQPGAQAVNPFWTQLNDNKNHYIGLQVTVPLFNGLKTRQNVQLAKVELEKSKVVRQQEELKVYQALELERAKQEQNTILALKTKETRDYAEKSLQTTQAKFSSGLVDAIVFTTAKNQLLTAEYNLLKAKVSAVHATLKINYLQSGRF